MISAIFIRAKVLYDRIISRAKHIDQNHLKYHARSARSGQTYPIGIGIKFHHNNANLRTLIVTRKKSKSLVGRCLCMCLIVQTWNQMITTCSCLWRTILLLKNSAEEKPAAIDETSFLPIGTRNCLLMATSY